MPYYGQLLFALQSLDNDALYHRNGKASPQFLVRPFALALIELRASMSIQILKLKNLNRAAEIAMDIYKVEQRMEAMRLTRQVSSMVHTIEDERKFAANNHL
jgi:hypothetical protein